MALVSQASRIELGQAFGLKKGVNFFLKPASPIEPSRGINQASNAGKPEALATGTNQFSCSERRLFHPRASEVKGTSSDNTGGKKTADPTCPVKTSLLLDDRRVTHPPRPVKEEGDVTLSDADIPDSITRALFDALQENRTGNQLPAMRISGSSRRRLVITAVIWRQGRNNQVRSFFLPKPTLSHTLEGNISNQPSTAVPAQMNSSRNGLTPAVEAETNVQADPLHGTRPYCDIILHSWRA